MNILPDMSSPKFYRNLALAILLPGAASYAFARYLQGRMSAQEVADFEKQVEEYTKAENPVVSLDPDLRDARKEKELENLGLGKKSSADPRIDLAFAAAKGPGVVGKVLGAGKAWFSTHPSYKYAAAGAGTYGAIKGGKAARNAMFKPDSAFTGTLEPGILLMLAYLALLGGLAMGKRKVAEQTGEVLSEQQDALSNELDAAEYDRLHQVSDPESYAAAKKRKAKKVAKVTVPKISYTEADVITSMVLLAKKANAVVDGVRALAATMTPGRKRALGYGIGIGAPIVGGIAYKGVKGSSAAAGSAWEALKLSYPLAFAVLLLGGLAAGKHFADKNDTGRIQSKGLKKYLAGEMLSQQSPTILEVGSELPWEKARAGGAELAQEEDAELPSEVAEREAKSRREIRI